MLVNYISREHASSILSLKKPLIIFLLLVIVQLAMSATRYFCLGDGRGNWQTADRSSAGLLPPASSSPEAMIRVFAARTVRWRGIFAVQLHAGPPLEVRFRNFDLQLDPKIEVVQPAEAKK